MPYIILRCLWCDTISLNVHAPTEDKIDDIKDRAIGLVLDFIHRLVCGRQKIPQRFGDWICLRPQVDGAG
jgi:hypothetical protein